MPVSHEIKSQLAKLLATEDLIVEHKKVETAQFNVHTRVLILPQWEKASNTVYDMLVGHEVGHALFTPDRNWIEDYKINPSIVNIVEDVRIEKLMKRRYAGLAKTFYHGYEELNDDDFFNVANEDLDTFSFADRINLHYKIGNFVDISFSDAEDKIVSLIGECETFEDVLKASQMVHDLCKKELELKEQQVKDGDGDEMMVNLPSDKKDDQPNPDDMTDEELLDELDKPSNDESSEEGEPQEEQPIQPQNEGGITGGDTSGDLDIKTVDTLADALKNLTNENAIENTYVEVPKIKLDQIIASNEEIHKHCEETWDPSNCQMGSVDVPNYLQWQLENKYNFEYVDQRFEEFKSSAKKEVNYLVKEFESKKSASAYARAATNRTGVLDTTKLHTYRFNEDIFKKVTVLPDGKNHGLVFILDWSGSMSHVMLDTIKQLYNLIWFCKKVQIPFEVYAFTNDYPLMQLDSDGQPRIARINPYEPKENLLVVAENFTLMNIFTSKVNAKTLNQQLKNIFRIAFAFNNGYAQADYHIPIKMKLSGTPLNESMIALHQIIPAFKKENKVEKVQCIVLTDGEGSNVPYHKSVQRRWEPSSYMGQSGVHTGCFLRDRKTGHNYAFSGGWYDMTDILLRNLRDRFPEVNFIGMRLLASRDAGYFIRNYYGSYGDEYEKLMRNWKKNKSFAIKKSGYHTYFGLSSNCLSEDTDFEVKEDATKAQIKSAFVKSLKSKKMNKKVLSEFIELVA